jgi:hypothetical protein
MAMILEAARVWESVEGQLMRRPIVLPMTAMGGAEVSGATSSHLTRPGRRASYSDRTGQKQPTTNVGYGAC